ncbi:MAG: hypothetical protein J5633_07190 [Oscillospiraceae bacterium]|nr:hypothetical protein [Oscillospiraceae bacterium]
MKRRVFNLIFLLVFFLSAAACAGKAPVPDPTPTPFSESPCVELKVKYLFGKNERYNLKLSAEKGTWSLVLTDHPGSILEPGTDIFVTGEAEDLPFDRFLEIFRAYHAEAWDGWETKGGEQDFSLELRFGDGSVYKVSGGDGPEGFDEFTEVLVREMARFGEDYGGVEPATVQERLMRVNPMFGDEGGYALGGGGISYDVYSFSRAVVPLGERAAKYHSPAHTSKNPALAGFLGEKLTETEKYEWYRVKGFRGKKYLISRDGEGNLRLWIFREFLSGMNEWARGECTAEELLREVYGVSGPEDIRKLIVSPGITDNAYPYSLEPEDRLHTWVLEDRETLDKVYEYLTEIGPLGDWRSEEAMNWRMERYGFLTYSFAPEGYRYWTERGLQIVLADSATIDKLIYDANCGFLYDYTYAGYCGMLSIEAAEYLNALFGIS